MIDNLDSFKLYSSIECLVGVYDNNPYVGVELRIYYGEDLIPGSWVESSCFDYKNIEYFIESNITSHNSIPTILFEPLSEYFRVLSLCLEAIL